MQVPNFREIGKKCEKWEQFLNKVGGLKKKKKKGRKKFWETNWRNFGK